MKLLWEKNGKKKWTYFWQPLNGTLLKKTESMKANIFNQTSVKINDLKLALTGIFTCPGAITVDGRTKKDIESRITEVRTVF